MSRRKTADQLEEEMWAAELSRAELYRKQLECDHYNAHAAEWYWGTGKVRLLRCPDCGAENYFEE